MARTAIIAGNWKMNHGVAATVATIEALNDAFAARPLPAGRQVVIAPQAPCLAAAVAAARGGVVSIAAQTVHHAAAGAYTGEWPAALLAELGVTHVIVGHSERREYNGETDDAVRAKFVAAAGAGLQVIACVGETWLERQTGRTFERIDRQVGALLAGTDATLTARLAIAYEPVWAIGTGLTATPEQAQAVHAHIRRRAATWAGAAAAEALPILYGGSVKADNIDALMAAADIDGALVGGASLDAASFGRIARFAAA